MHSHHPAARRGFLPPLALAAAAAARGRGPDFGFNPRDFGRDFGPGPRGFGPRRGFGPGGPRARRGDVRSAILGLLADGPSNGYGLIRAIAERTDDAWQPSPGSVYPTLSQLVDEGLISKAEDQRGEYALTDEGRGYVEAHREAIDEAFDKARGDVEADELRSAIGKLVGSLSQFRAASTDQRARATQKVDELRRELYAILSE